jgi:hypothetical protein
MIERSSLILLTSFCCCASFPFLSRAYDVRHMCVRTGRMWISLSALVCYCVLRKKKILSVSRTMHLLLMTLIDWLLFKKNSTFYYLKSIIRLSRDYLEIQRLIQRILIKLLFNGCHSRCNSFKCMKYKDNHLSWITDDI